MWLHLIGVLLLQAILFAAPGELDKSFGDEGRVLTDIAGKDAIGYDMAIQADKKIVVAGSSEIDQDTYKFALVRYNKDGSKDSSFGQGGIITTVISDDDAAYAIAIQKDGKIIAAGRSNTGIWSTPGIEDFAMVRYLKSDGSPDSSFGNGGKVVTDFNNDSDRINDIAIQGDNKIVAIGYANVKDKENFALARYFDTNGSLDKSFGVDGKVLTHIANSTRSEAETIAIQKDKKIVVGGSAAIAHSWGGNIDFALARYSDINGSLDKSFGLEGIVTTPMSQHSNTIYSIVIQGDGKIIAAGGAQNDDDNYDCAMARYDVNGSLDTNFGEGGIVISKVGNSDSEIFNLSIQKDGKIIAVGYSLDINDNPSFTVLRYNMDGTIDQSFGDKGIVTTQFENAYSYAGSSAMQENGKIVVSGMGDDGTEKFAVARYLNDSIVMAPIYYLLQ